MITQVQHHNIVICQAITDTRHGVISCLNFYLRRLKLLRAFHYQSEHVRPMFVKTFDWNLQSIVQLLYKDLDLCCHSRSNVFRGINDLDDRRIFFDR